jgi:Zn-dependent peptidase ImmA (M78 family)
MTTSEASEVVKKREPVRAIGIDAAKRVREAIGYEHPTDVEIEIVAFMRGALVRPCPAKGARANLMRLGDRGVIGVSEGLSLEERRWAVAHELGHFEAHPDVSFESLCSSTDMLPTYKASGREPEANAFAAELLMPEDLFSPKCQEISEIEWRPIEGLAFEFTVSVMAAAIRFIHYTPTRTAIVCTKNSKVEWSTATESFGPKPKRGSPTHPLFNPLIPSARDVPSVAWLEDSPSTNATLLHEQVLPIPLPNKSEHLALTLLQFK